MEQDSVQEVVFQSGNPRVWARRVLDIFENVGHISQAMEIDFGNVTHTFVKAFVGGEAYIIDPFEVNGNPSFIGREEDAPPYFKEATMDPINLVRQAEKELAGKFSSEPYFSE